MTSFAFKFYTFRFDDVCANTDTEKLLAMVKFLRHGIPGGAVITFAVSPLVHWPTFGMVGAERERVFPATLHLQADFRKFYNVHGCSLSPRLPAGHAPGTNPVDLADRVASHGLIHVDHRLLHRAAQEMSIVVSCSLLNTTWFSPPFHKYNQDTIDICAEHGITLDRLEFDFSGAPTKRHLKYQPFDPAHRDYYLHTHDFADLAAFAARFPF